MPQQGVASLVDVAKASVQAYNEKNWDKVRDSLTPDCVYEDVPYAEATVVGPDVTVSGTVINTTGRETGVVVNGYPATISGSRFKAVRIPLQEGGNTILATASPQGWFGLNGSLAIGKDDYTNDGEFGLRDNTHHIYTAGVTIIPNDRSNVDVSYGFEHYAAFSTSRQANPGVQFSDPSRNWGTDQADKVSHYNILKREVDNSRQLYDSLLQHVKEAGIASALRASNVRVIDSAKPPARPHQPSPCNHGGVPLREHRARCVGLRCLRL